MVVGDLKLNLRNHEVRVKERLVELTLREFEVLKYLAKQSGKVVSRETLLAEVFEPNYKADIRVVDITVRRIREKIEENANEPKILLTRRGIGYYLNDGKGVTPTISINTDKRKIQNISEKEKIVIWNEEIEIDNIYTEYYKLKQKFEEKGQIVKRYLMSHLDSINYQKTFSVAQTVISKCEDDIKEIVKELVEKNLFTIKIEDFHNLGYIKLKKTVRKLIDEQNRLDSKAAAELNEECRQEYRRINRYNRWDYTIFGPMPGEKKRNYQEFIRNRSNYKIGNMQECTIEYFKNTTYYELLQGIDEFYDDLVRDYIVKLYSIQKIVRTPGFVRTSEINTMFDNLKLIENKKKILIEILKNKPREKRAYMYIIKNGMFDEEILNLSKKVYIDKELKNEIENSIKYENNREKEFIKALALLKNKKSEEVFAYIKKKDDEKLAKEQQKIEEQKEQDRIRKKQEDMDKTIEIILKVVGIIGFIIFLIYARYSS